MELGNNVELVGYLLTDFAFAAACLLWTRGAFLPVTALGDQASGGVPGVPLKARADRASPFRERVQCTPMLATARIGWSQRPLLFQSVSTYEIHQVTYIERKHPF